MSCRALRVVVVVVIMCCLSSCGGIPTPMDGDKLPAFHVFMGVASGDPLREDALALYVDYSTCIAMGQHSPFYQKLVPSWVSATKEYYSIQGNNITKEDLTEMSTYERLRSVHEVNYADLKTAAEMIANGNSEGVLLTDGEYYQPTIAGGNANNPYMSEALKTWLRRGHDVYILSEPYMEPCNGVMYAKKRFYFLFTDSRLRNNIYSRVCATAQLSTFPEVQVFHLSADHPTVLSSGASSTPNELLAATVTPYDMYEIQDWTVDWKSIENFIMGNGDENGDCVISGLKVDRNSFGGYRIKDISLSVRDLNEAYMTYYDEMEQGVKPTAVKSLPECDHFLLVDDAEFSRHGNIDVYFDIYNLDNSFLRGNPYNYFRIDFYISSVEVNFAQYAKMFEFDLLGHPGVKNCSVVSSVEQCLTDESLRTQMLNSPFYTIYVKSNKK